MWVCATFATDARMTPSSIRLVYPAMLFTFNWCRSNRSVPEHRQRSLHGLHCQNVINFSNRFTSEILFSCRYVVTGTLIQTTCYLTFSSDPGLSGASIAGRPGTCHFGILGAVANDSSGRSISDVPWTLRMLPPSCSRSPHVRLIFLECGFVSSVDQCCNWHQVCSRWQPSFS